MKQGFVACCAATAIAVAAPSAAFAQTGGKTVQLSKVVLDTESAELVARVKGGTLCVFPSNIKIPKEKKTQNYERFDNMFTAKFKSGGFAVLSTSSDMFAGADDKNKADYLIGVTLRPVGMNVCSSVKGEKGDMDVNAEWQIFDRGAGKIVETVSASGHGTLPKFASDGLDQIMNEAFKANLGALLDKGIVQKYTAQAPAQ